MNLKKDTEQLKDSSESNIILKKQIHTRISSEAYAKIEELAKVLGSKAKVIEEAVDFYQKYKSRWDEKQKLWNRARELQMVLVGKTTFNSYISGDANRAWEENIATEVIEWVMGKHIDELSIRESLEAIKKMWEAANYFSKIEIITKLESGQDSKTKNDSDDLKGLGSEYIEVRFYHTFNKNFSIFWSGYFRTWLEKHYRVKIEEVIRNERFTLKIFKK